MSVEPLLTIVTVTFRDLEGLSRTLRSLRDLCETAGDMVQLVVCDGGTSGVRQVFTEMAPAGAVLSSTPDAGIYDAMNRGLDISRGEFVWFLNGGDQCLVQNWEVLRSVLDAGSRNSVHLFGYRRVARELVTNRRPRSVDYLWHGLPTSHQAILYPGPIVRAVRYDLDFSVTGDYALTCKLWIEKDLSWNVCDIAIAEFELGGFSSLHGSVLRREAWRIQRDILGVSLLRRAASMSKHMLAAQVVNRGGFRRLN